MKRKLAIFDMDETLVSSDFTWALAAGRYLDRCGIKHDQSIDKVFPDHGVSYVISLLKNEYGIRKPDFELFNELTEETLYDYRHNVTLKNHASEVVSLFRKAGFFTCILSANSPVVLEIVKDRFSSSLEMDAWFSTRNFIWSKDNPKVFDLIASFFGLKPSDCVLFDDALYAIKTANSIKMPYVWLSEKTNYLDDQKTEINNFSSFSDAMPRIKEIIGL